MVKTIDELETLFDSFEPSLSSALIRENRIERMERLLEHIGNPEQSFSTYHTAGSKGKGTTSSYIAALLTGSGRRTGLYLSPHMYTVRERFTLSTAFFPDEVYIESANKLLSKIDGFTFPSDLGAVRPTTFELYTAYAYLLFKDAGCTDAVIETGLGGRLDATNTLFPKAVILTPIEKEHTAILGNTIKEIAGEKAKIMRHDVPTFSSFQTPEARAIFEKEAEDINTTIEFVSDSVSDFLSKTDINGEHVSFTLDGTHYDFKLAMSTKAMAENALLSILTAKRLGFLTDEGIRRMESTVLPGRFEKKIIDGRLVVIDGAHTPLSAKATADAFFSIAKGKSCLIYSSVMGKDIEGIIMKLFPHFDKIIITSTGDFKKSDPEGIFSLSKSLFPDYDISIDEDRNHAFSTALSYSSSILVTGSFYLASGIERLRRHDES